MGLSSAHFSEDELACRACGFNGCQQKLLDALEGLRSIVGVPITLDCAFRCPLPPAGVVPCPGHCGHNAAVGGVPNSEHELGTAADIKIQGMTAVQMYAVANKVPTFASGGIGVAERQGYIHLDVRSVRARWCYDAAGKSCAWDPAIDQQVA